MQGVAMRNCAVGSAALVLAGSVAAAPIAARQPALPVVSMPTRLVDADSILYVPFNLFEDIVNIPYNEVEAVNFGGESLLNSGPWFADSATNLWGVDPGDPSHFESLVNVMLPFPALSGMGASETDFTAGLGQQIWGMQAAELAVNSACDADTCLPTAPTSPITGVTSIDSLIWLYEEFTGQQQFPLIDDWEKVPLGTAGTPGTLLGGYTFTPGAEGSYDPSGPAYQIFDNILGTSTIDGVANSMPWAGDTYTLEPWVPFENFFTSLTVAPTGLSGFEFPTFEEIGRALQTYLAGEIVAFDPFTPGSPFCPGECTAVTNAHLDYPDLVKDIDKLWPGNADIQAWVDAYDNGTANVPTAEQIATEIANTQQGNWDFGNPSPPSGSGPDFTQTTEFFHQLWADLGFNPPALPEAAAADPASALASASDPGQLSAGLTTLSADLSTLLASLEPAALSADLSTMMAHFAATLGPDLGTAVLSSF